MSILSTGADCTESSLDLPVGWLMEGCTISGISGVKSGCLGGGGVGSVSLPGALNRLYVCCLRSNFGIQLG